MDTRNKILPADAAIEIAFRVKHEGRKLIVVTGYFDVLGAAHVRDLAAVRKRIEDGVLMVVLLSKAEPLLSERARAELVAGLRVVDYVVIAGEDGVVSRLPADEGVSRQAADEEQTRLLMEHVLSRHSL
jgi:bifunctional ADP-heptose synthase (sugar kinase/adenylyltransferase)